MHNFDMNDWNMHGFGWLFWLIVIALLIWFIVSFLSGRNRNISNESALDILKKRFARGEITKEEFEEKKKALE